MVAERVRYVGPHDRPDLVTRRERLCADLRALRHGLAVAPLARERAFWRALPRRMPGGAAQRSTCRHHRCDNHEVVVFGNAGGR